MLASRPPTVPHIPTPLATPCWQSWYWVCGGYGRNPLPCSYSAPSPGNHVALRDFFQEATSTQISIPLLPSVLIHSARGSFFFLCSTNSINYTTDSTSLLYYLSPSILWDLHEGRALPLPFVTIFVAFRTQPGIC